MYDELSPMFLFTDSLRKQKMVSHSCGIILELITKVANIITRNVINRLCRRPRSDSAHERENRRVFFGSMGSKVNLAMMYPIFFLHFPLNIIIITTFIKRNQLGRTHKIIRKPTVKSQLASITASRSFLFKNITCFLEQLIFLLLSCNKLTVKTIKLN